MGPFRTEREARETAAVQAVYEASRANPGVGRMAPHTSLMILDSCRAARVDLGAYDMRIVSWLGQWEPETVAVIAGLIERAYRDGRAGERGRRSPGSGPLACDVAPVRGRCGHR